MNNPDPTDRCESCGTELYRGDTFGDDHTGPIDWFDMTTDRPLKKEYLQHTPERCARFRAAS